MKRFRLLLLTVFFTGLLVSVAGAATIDLFEYLVEGGSADLSAFDTSTGLGSVTLSFGGVGSHEAGLYVDIEIDQAVNTFFNEYGTTSGSPVAGQSWEIDEPGFVFGDIYTNFTAGALDNSNGVPQTKPDDVSMAMGWNFMLDAGQTATIRYFITETAPSGGFYLAQIDPDSQATIYLQSTLNIQGGGNQVPEPSTLLLIGPALGGLYFMRRRMKG